MKNCIESEEPSTVIPGFSLCGKSSGARNKFINTLTTESAHVLFPKVLYITIFLL